MYVCEISDYAKYDKFVTQNIAINDPININDQLDLFSFTSKNKKSIF